MPVVPHNFYPISRKPNVRLLIIRVPLIVVPSFSMHDEENKSNFINCSVYRAQASCGERSTLDSPLCSGTTISWPCDQLSVFINRKGRQAVSTNQAACMVLRHRACPVVGLEVISCCHARTTTVARCRID